MSDFWAMKSFTILFLIGMICLSANARHVLLRPMHKLVDGRETQSMEKMLALARSSFSTQPKDEQNVDPKMKASMVTFYVISKMIF